MQELNANRFQYAGQPVELSWELDELGRGDITLVYGDAAEIFEVGVPKQLDIPGLARFEGWMKVLRFVETEPGRSTDEIFELVEAGEITDRLAIVTRTPKPEDRKGLMGLDVDEDAWGYGEVMRKHWDFAFYELIPGGGIRAETLNFPSAKHMETPVEGELKRGTWQYDAALRTMPKGSAPKQNFTEDSLVNAGWRLGVAGTGALVFTVGLAFACAPSRRASGSSSDKD